MELIEKDNDLFLIINDKEHSLSKKEYFLLKHFLENRGKVLETKKLCETFQINPHTFRNYLSKFRKEFGLEIRWAPGFVYEED